MPFLKKMVRTGVLFSLIGEGFFYSIRKGDKGVLFALIKKRVRKEVLLSLIKKGFRKGFLFCLIKKGVRKGVLLSLSRKTIGTGVLFCLTGERFIFLNKEGS